MCCAIRVLCNTLACCATGACCAMRRRVVTTRASRLRRGEKVGSFLVCRGPRDRGGNPMAKGLCPTSNHQRVVGGGVVQHACCATRGGVLCNTDLSTLPNYRVRASKPHLGNARRPVIARPQTDGPSRDIRGVLHGRVPACCTTRRVITTRHRVAQHPPVFRMHPSARAEQE